MQHGRITNNDLKNLYLVQLYMNWTNGHYLPCSNIYDMPCDLMLRLIAIHNLLNEGPEPSPGKETEDPSNQPLLPIPPV